MIGEEDCHYSYDYDAHYKILPAINDWYLDPERIKNGKISQNRVLEKILLKIGGGEKIARAHCRTQVQQSYRTMQVRSCRAQRVRDITLRRDHAC